MRKQSPIALFFLILFTLGIYEIVWLARTRGEMNRMGADIPTTWLIIVPIANIWYLWKWSQGVEHVTNGKTSGILAFILQWLLGAIGSAILQDGFNNVSATPSADSVNPAAQAPQAATEGAQPAETAPVTTEESSSPEQPEAEPAPAADSSEEQKPTPDAPTNTMDATSSDEQPPKEGETL